MSYDERFTGMVWHDWDQLCSTFFCDCWLLMASLACNTERGGKNFHSLSRTVKFDQDYRLMWCKGKCYRPSMRPNCSRGTCSGLGTWRPRCTQGALSGTRHIVLTPSLSLIAHVTVLMSGVASPTGHASYTTRASVRVPVPFPQLSPHVRKLSSNHSQSLRFGSAGDRSRIASYCLVSPRVCLSGS